MHEKKRRKSYYNSKKERHKGKNNCRKKDRENKPIKIGIIASKFTTSGRFQFAWGASGSFFLTHDVIALERKKDWADRGVKNLVQLKVNDGWGNSSIAHLTRSIRMRLEYMQLRHNHDLGDEEVHGHKN